MKIYEKIIKREIGVLDLMKMSPEELLINQKLYALDLSRHRMELKWGCGRLQELASAELRGKWDAQMQKLNDAIMDINILLVDELIAGCVRGWNTLEAAAIKNGHVPYEPQFWELQIDTARYRVVRDMQDAHVASIKAKDCVVVSLEELVRVFHVRHERVFKTHPVTELVHPANRSMNEELGF